MLMPLRRRAWRSIRTGAKTGLGRVSKFCCGGPRLYSTTEVEGEKQRHTIRRDVCIIGGGATGTFAPIRLRDQGKSAAIVEQGPRLGGHTITFQDDVTGAKTEAGLVVIRDSPVSRQYFSRFNIPLVKFEPPAPDAEVFVDFVTGKQLNFTSQFPAQTFAAYATQLAKYPFLDNGFHLPATLPEDLALPFGEFVKNSVKASGISSPSHDDVLLDTTVISTTRSDSVRIVTRSAVTGKETLIKAKRLLITIPPTPTNLAPFDPDARELALFPQFRHTAWCTALVRNSGLPDNHYITNLTSAGPRTSRPCPPYTKSPPRAFPTS
ncbi:hypothetical protein V8F06_011626 [Rhypophila decipiens]